MDYLLTIKTTKAVVAQRVRSEHDAMSDVRKFISVHQRQSDTSTDLQAINLFNHVKKGQAQALTSTKTAVTLVVQIHEDEVLVGS